MKTILFFSVALLLSCATFAQSDGQPDFPYVTYDYEMMAPDCNDPHPWGVLVTKSTASDAIPALGWVVVNQKVPRPPLSEAPIYPTAKKHEGMMSPEGVFPNVEYPHRKKMLPY